MRLQDRIARGLMLQGGGNVLGLVGGIARTVVIARLVAAADIGVYALTLIAVGLSVQLGGLGHGAALYHYDEIGTGVLRRCLAAATLGGAICGAVAGGLFLPPAGEVGVLLFAVATGTAAAGQTCAEVCGTHLSLRLAYARVAATGAAARLLGDAAAIAIVVVYPTLFGLLLSLAAQGTLLGLLYLGAAYRTTGLRARATPHAAVRLSRVTRLGLLSVVDGFLNFGVSRLDRLVVSGVFGVSVLGYYEVVASLAAKPLEIIISTARAIYAPLITRFVRRPGGLRVVHRDFVGAIGLLVTPVIGVAVCFGESLLGVLYGEAYAEYYAVYVGLSVLAFTKSVGLPVWQYIVAAGRMRLSIAANLWIGLLRVGVLYVACLLLPLGAAVGAYVAARAGTSWAFEQYIRRTAFGLSLGTALRPLRATVIRTLVACLVGYLTALLYSTVVRPTPPVIVALPTAALLYALLSRADLHRGWRALRRERTSSVAA